MEEKVKELLDNQTMKRWNTLIQKLDKLYDVDRIWKKGFGEWAIEYKYRRGGKTLCAFYAKEGVAALLLTYGRAERDQFEQMREEMPEELQRIYDSTETFHDGKWMWIPIDETMHIDGVIKMITIKRRPNRK